MKQSICQEAPISRSRLLLVVLSPSSFRRRRTVASYKQSDYSKSRRSRSSRSRSSRSRSPCTRKIRSPSPPSEDKERSHHTNTNTEDEGSQHSDDRTPSLRLEMESEEEQSHSQSHSDDMTRRRAVLKIEIDYMEVLILLYVDQNSLNRKSRIVEVPRKENVKYYRL
jgi:hypothetical protein